MHTRYKQPAVKTAVGNEEEASKVPMCAQLAPPLSLHSEDVGLLHANKED